MEQSSFFEKRCFDCGEVKSVEEFRRPGHNNCRKCLNRRSNAKRKPETIRKNIQRWKDRNREKVRAEGRAYYHRTKDTDRHKAQQREYQRRYRERKHDLWLARAHGRRAEVFRHYGNQCECCGETEMMFLTIDHINDDGAKQRREKRRSTGIDFYRQIIAAGFPTDLRLLCWNCNSGRHRNGGVCPHEQRREELLAA